MDERYLRPEDASRVFKVTKQTLVNWANEGKIECKRTPGGHRRYLKSDVLRISRDVSDKPTVDDRKSVCYCRVSTAGQKEDLERQVEFFKTKYPTYEIIRDIGSGLNFKRKGLKTLLEYTERGTLKEVVVTHRDRLCRFGFDLLKTIIESRNGSIVVLDQQTTSPEKELVDDILQIITVFSSRLHGLRSWSVKRNIKKLKEANAGETRNTCKSQETSSSEEKGRDEAIKTERGEIEI
jgi:predicted site-specific integrase-resolvase